MKRSSLGVVLLLTSTLAFSEAVNQTVSQTQHEQIESFWNTPGQLMYDPQGRLTYGEFRNALTRTEQVYDNGTWLTRYYAPDALRYLKVVGPDAIDSFEYDSKGNLISTTTEQSGLVLKVVHQSAGLVAAAGLPDLLLTRTPGGRVQQIASVAGPFVTYRYSPSGEVSMIELPDQSTLSFEAGPGAIVIETFRGPGNQIVRKLATRNGYGGGRWHLLHLDLVAQSFGLGLEWMNQIRVKWNSTGSLATITDLAGNTLFHLMRSGTLNVAFDAAGNGLFYDLDLTPDILDSRSAPSGIVPTRVLITPDERIEIAAPMAPDGAIESLWFDRTAPGPPTWHSRILASSVLHRQATRPLSIRLYAYCDSSTTCDYDNYGNGGCTTTNYYCDYNDGSQYSTTCYDCGDPYGGGGGGAPSDFDSNRIPPSPLHTAVNRAIQTAVNKLNTDGCLAVFGDFTTINGDTPAQELQNKGMSATYYLASWMLFYDGSNSSTCINSNDLAWTSPGNQVVYVCNNNGRFVSNSNSTYIGNTMIHEELHSLWLGENPPSSADIQNQVAARCGS